jgi:hypothetical protein
MICPLRSDAPTVAGRSTVLVVLRGRQALCKAFHNHVSPAQQVVKAQISRRRIQPCLVSLKLPSLSIHIVDDTDQRLDKTDTGSRCKLDKSGL